MPAGEEGSISWVCGEVATVEVEIRNPTVIPIKVCAPRASMIGVTHCIPPQYVCRQTGKLTLFCVMRETSRVWQVERLTLEVEWAGHPSVAPRDQMALQQAVWKPNPVAMWLPPETPATKVRSHAVCHLPHHVPGRRLCCATS